jgi:tetratricopeptide (TPR) repeat protein
MSLRAAVLLAVLLVLVFLTPARLPAIFMRMETQTVPVERLISNLESEIKASPTNAQAMTNLARVHAMAYALKVDRLPAVQSDASAERPFYPPGASRVPDVVVPPKSAEHKAAADRHLTEAIRHYEAALALDPRNITARLGHGWVLEQRGDKPKAIDEYRRVVELAWPSEEKIKALGVGQRLYTQEAARYLIPLLDPARDRAEIQDLTAKQESLKARPRAVTPIAIPLAEGVEGSAIVDPRARVRFDADGSALDYRWTWITPNAAWLVYDGDGTGSIRSALQLFGSVTFWLFWNNGYDAMRALDDNRDGELSGGELRHLALWHDRNANGISDAGEVRSLASAGVVALSCQYEDGDGVRFEAFSPRGVRFSDGRTRPTYDVVLRHSQPDWTLTRR